MSVQITIEDHLIPYLILLFHVLIIHLIRITVKSLLSNKEIFHIFNEIISTIELCSCCYELGPVWSLHGNIGLSIALFLLCCWWCQTWDEAEACPCGPFEEILIERQSNGLDLSKKLLAQLIGGWLSSRYVKLIWCWHLTEIHRELHEQQCEASLYVTPFYGAIIEGLITFISRIVSLESGKWNHLISTIANSITSVCLVLFALNTTGGFFNPILASALMFGCQGHTHLEHFQVYWFGSLTGSLLARWIHKNLLQQQPAENDNDNYIDNNNNNLMNNKKYQ